VHVERLVLSRVGVATRCLLRGLFGFVRRQLELLVLCSQSRRMAVAVQAALLMAWVLYMLASAFVLLAAAQESAAWQPYSVSDIPWTSSPSGKMSMYLNHNTNPDYRFALCIPPGANGIPLLQPSILVDSELLRYASVYFGVTLGVHKLENIQISSESARLSLGIDEYLVRADGGRMEVTLQAVLKNNSLAIADERIAMRLLMTCAHMPLPPPPFRAPSLDSPPPPAADALAAMLHHANSCITPSCLAKAYIQYQTFVLNHLETAVACEQSTGALSHECSDLARSGVNVSDVHFLIFRPIPRAGWGNSALLLMEAVQFALADWRILLIDTPFYKNIVAQLSGPFVVSNADAQMVCAAAGAQLHTGTHLRNSIQEPSDHAAAFKSRARVLVVEILADSPLTWLDVHAAAHALHFPRALDIVPPFLYDALGFAARIVIHPSLVIRDAMRAMKHRLAAARCSRIIGVHLRGGFIDGDFHLHENRTPVALARVVQAARQAAEDAHPVHSTTPADDSSACHIIAGDHADNREFVRAALETWGFAAFDISAPAHELANVGLSGSVDAARAALTEWFILSTADTIIVQQHSSFGLSAGIYGGSRGFTVAEHRVINGFSCHPWNGENVCSMGSLPSN